MPMSVARWLKIQSTATINSTGARTHPCQTRDVVEKRWENLLPIITVAPVWVRRSFSQMRLLAHKPFQIAFLSTESKADLISTNGGVSDSVINVLENYGNHPRFRVADRRTPSWMIKMVATDKEGAADKQCLGEGKLQFRIQCREAPAPSYLEMMLLSFSTMVQDASVWSMFILVTRN